MIWHYLKTQIFNFYKKKILGILICWAFSLEDISIIKSQLYYKMYIFLKDLSLIYVIRNHHMFSFIYEMIQRALRGPVIINIKLNLNLYVITSDTWFHTTLYKRKKPEGGKGYIIWKSINGLSNDISHEWVGDSYESARERGQLVSKEERRQLSPL